MTYVGVCHDCLTNHGDIIANSISKGRILGVHVTTDKDDCYLQVMHPEELTLKEKVEGRIERYKKDVEYFKKIEEDSAIRLFEGKLQSMEMVLKWIELEEEKQMEVNMSNVGKVINVRDTEFPEDSIGFQFYKDGDVVITMLDDQDAVFTVVVKKDKLFKALGVKEEG